MILWNAAVIFFSLLNRLLLSTEGVRAPLCEKKRLRSHIHHSSGGEGRAGREQEQQSRAGSGTWGCECSPRAARAPEEAEVAGNHHSHVWSASSKVFIHLLCHLLGLSFLLEELEKNLFHYLLGCCSSCLFPRRKRIRCARAESLKNT